MALLEVKNINAGYGKKQVLYDISFEVEQGEIVLLIGSNGSGKSTLLKAIYGLVQFWNNLNFDGSNKSSVYFNSENITDLKPYQMIEKGLVYIPQKNNTFEQLSVFENLQLVAHNTLPKDSVERRINAVFKNLPQLAELKSRIPFQLSGGEKQQLALGMSLIPKPKMIMLDEPSAGLSPSAWLRNLQIVKALNQKEITFLIVEHNVQETGEIADTIFQMKLGRIENLMRYQNYE